jgi:hypothetical protein
MEWPEEEEGVKMVQNFCSISDGAEGKVEG